jgi:SAM-dependent methyltransferase
MPSLEPAQIQPPVPPARCLLCGSTEVAAVDANALKCGRCALLMSAHTQELDYSQGGGQSVPDPHKMKWRLLNAEFRFRIIRRFLAGHRLFVDVGCGSGEMLSRSKALFPWHIGFDTNTILIDHIVNSLGLNAVNSFFDPALIKEEWRRLPKVITVAHVLEHLAEPMVLLRRIAAFMAPGDLLYVEVPLHTGRSFAERQYAWNLWNPEHLALYSPAALEFIAAELGFDVLDRNCRIFARGSKSGKTLIRLFLSSPLQFLRLWATKPAYLSMADVMIRDYGYIVLKK